MVDVKDAVSKSRYGMVWEHHAQRDEYERLAPSLWKHLQLPEWIRDQRRQAIDSSDYYRGVYRDARLNNDIKAMEVAEWKGKLAVYKYAEERALLELFIERYRHGLEMGFPELDGVLRADEKNTFGVLLKEVA